MVKGGGGLLNYSGDLNNDAFLFENDYRSSNRETQLIKSSEVVPSSAQNPYDSFNQILEDEHKQLRKRTLQVVQESQTFKVAFDKASPIPCPFLKFISDF